jgi:adenylate kinase
MARQNPNIIVTGTPGVGKTTHAEQLARSTGLKHISVNQIVKDEGFHEGKDEETGSWIVDEDKVRYICLLSFFTKEAFPAHIERLY